MRIIVVCKTSPNRLVELPLPPENEKMMQILAKNSR
jgi:hypothetical protein